MAKYLVHLNTGLAQVVISLDRYGPTASEGMKEIGSFELEVDPVDNQLVDPEGINKQGDHIFIAKAREILRDELDDDTVNLDRYTFIDRASNAVVEDEHAYYSTDALPATDGEGARDAEASAQAGGVKSAATHEVHAETQEQGDKAETPPATEATTENKSENAEGESEDKPETVAELKARIAGITDKEKLQDAYTEEQEGKNRPTAIKAIEDRAAELEAA